MTAPKTPVWWLYNWIEFLSKNPRVKSYSKNGSRYLGNMSKVVWPVCWVIRSATIKKTPHLERSIPKIINRRQNTSMMSVKLYWISQQFYSNKKKWITAFQIYDTCLKGSCNFIRYFEAKPLKKSSEFECIMEKTIDRSQNTSMMTL